MEDSMVLRKLRMAAKTSQSSRPSRVTEEDDAADNTEELQDHAIPVGSLRSSFQQNGSRSIHFGGSTSGGSMGLSGLTATTSSRSQLCCFGSSWHSFLERPALRRRGLDRGLGSRSFACRVVDAVMRHASLAFQLWENNKKATAYVKGLHPEFKSRWCLVYCGVANPIETQLKKTAEAYNLDLHFESFAW